MFRIPFESFSGLAFAATLAYHAVAMAGGEAPDWTGISTSFFPLEPAAVTQPVIGPEDVTDATAYFCADPFIMHDTNTWFLFFEAVTPRGKIAVATSPDGLAWTYQHIVLQEGFHLSFPCVFKHDGTYYMTPESGSQRSVRLYRSKAFPDGWVYEADIVKGRDFSDPSLFQYAGRWWMFVSNGASDTCWLYSSLTLDHGWEEHPRSPIVLGNRARARPAGRTVVLNGNRIYRLAQNCTPNYGHAVRIFQVDALSTTVYEEHEISASPILQATGSGWNELAMHQCDPWWVGDHWLASVDGAGKNSWSIGIYRTPVSDVGLQKANLGSYDLRCTPNPFSGSTMILGAGSWAGSSRPTQLLVHDPAGRLVYSRYITIPTNHRSAIVWDGTNDSGRHVAAGTYFCTVRQADRQATARAIVVR